MSLTFFYVGLFVAISGVHASGLRKFGLRLTQGSNEASRESSSELYLIPRSTQSCLPFSSASVSIDDDMSLTRYDPSGSSGPGNPVLRFPGCFQLDAEMTVTDNDRVAHWNAPDTKFIAHQKWEWLQAGGNGLDANFTDLSCQNQNEFGCEGTGNNCYYCDLCDEIVKYNERNNDNPIKQCPREVGIFSWKTDRCVNDWGELDKDKNGKADFLESPDWPEVKEFLQKFHVQGIGTVRLQLKIGLSEDATQAAQMNKDKLAKKSEWPSYYAKQWLPKLVNDNMVACVNVFFDVCDKEPTFKSNGPVSVGSNTYVC